jgi:hypothetical protein
MAMGVWCMVGHDVPVVTARAEGACKFLDNGFAH